MNCFEFIRYTAACHKYLDFKQFIHAYCNLYYPDQDIDFMIYLTNICCDEKRNQCIVPHSVLLDKKIITEDMPVMEMMEFLKFHGLTIHDDFIHGVGEILLTPIAFLFIWIFYDADTHFDYTVVIEEITIAFDLYKSMI